MYFIILINVRFCRISKKNFENEMDIGNKDIFRPGLSKKKDFFLRRKLSQKEITAVKGSSKFDTLFN